MNEAQLVIQTFGSLTETARALNHKYVSTVQGWRDKGRIPHWRRAEIFLAAERTGKLPEIEAILGPKDAA